MSVVPSSIPNISSLSAPYVPGSGTMALTTGAPAAFGSQAGGTTIYFTVRAPNNTVVAFATTGRSGDTLTGVTAVEGNDQYFPLGSMVAVAVEDTAGPTITLSSALAALGGGPPSSGYTIVYNGSSYVQQAGGAGTVTNVATGAGLTGGPITGTGTIALASTGLVITQHSGALIVPSGTSGTITMDLSLGDWQIPATCTGNFTLALSNPTVGQQFTVICTQAASGGPYGLTWFSGITWIGSVYTAPTMPATASAKLGATFKCVASNTYLGFWLGNSAA